MKPGIWIVVAAFLGTNAHACIWDADSLWQEKMRSHDLTSAILGDPPEPEDPQKLRARISELESHRDETNADWWNNLAGAHLRLNEPAEAVKILEPVVTNFPNNYGIHANLGTAYHLLGRYADAEKEIARDLEINPDAHFGLEKYHLALLQYLMRDTNYQSRHVYVDEFSRGFQQLSQLYLKRPEGKLDLTNTNGLEMTQIDQLEKEIADEPQSEKTNSWEWVEIQKLKLDCYNPPSYRYKWDLAADTNFVPGVIYMAQMNPGEPACFEMLGIAASRKHDYHLALSAYEKAIALGSLKADSLRQKVESLHHFIHESFWNNLGIYAFIFLIPFVIACYIYTKIRDYRRNRIARN
jgi:tetratricopeptide (TPR) repeat protein